MWHAGNDTIGRLHDPVQPGVRLCGTHRSAHMRGCPGEFILQPLAKEGLLFVDGQMTSLKIRRH